MSLKKFLGLFVMFLLFTNMISVGSTDYIEGTSNPEETENDLIENENNSENNNEENLIEESLQENEEIIYSEEESNTSVNDNETNQENSQEEITENENKINLIEEENSQSEINTSVNNEENAQTNNSEETENQVKNLEYTLNEECSEDLNFTEWSEWENLFCSEEKMNQSISRIEYDANNCGTFENVTHYEHQLVEPIYQNTSWSEWENIGCVASNINQSSYLIQYDVYGCASNKTFYEYTLLEANLQFTNWSIWENLTCVNATHRNQTRYRVEYDAVDDANNLGCFESVLHREYRTIEDSNCYTQIESNIKINLISPANNALIKQSEVSFSYKVNSSLPLKNCTGYVYKTNIFGQLVTSSDSLIERNDYSILEKNKEYKIILTGLENGNYVWGVECYDNQSANSWEVNYFRINKTESVSTTTSGSGGSGGGGSGGSTSYTTLSHEKTEEISEVVERINNFLEKYNSLNLDEKEAVDNLNLLDNLDFYKRRLNQINQDLGSVIITEQRKQELGEEIASIELKIPSEIRVIKTKEYVKNTFEGNMEEILSKYFEYKNINIERNLFRKTVSFNEELQKNLFVETKMQNVEIVYNRTQDKITLISKKLNIKETQIKNILEYFPEEIKNNITFITNSKKIGNNLFEIETEEKKLIYQIEGFLELDSIEKIETVLFEDSIEKTSAGITGAVTGVLEEGSFGVYTLFFLGIFLFLASGFFVYKKIKIKKLEEEPNSSRINEFIRQANLCLKEKDLEAARDYYKKMQEIYPLIDEEYKDVIYEKIKKMRIEIDKKDISNLVKEYKKAKSDFRKEDALLFYQKIKSVYKRLPKKYQEKVYEKLNLDF